MRIYYNGSTLKRHIDRTSCEYSVSLCIENDVKPWDIWFENKKGETVNIALEEGDLVIYKGAELDHWRNKYEGKQQIQLLLHYVDKNGNYANEAFDGRKMLGIPNS